MPSAQPHLASWARRLLAAALDAALLVVIGVFMYGAIETAQLDREALFLALAILYAAYQGSSTLWPQFSIGRTVAGIVVLSATGDGAPTLFQASARPLIRLALLFVFYAFGVVFRAEWLVAVPFAIELLLIAHTTWRQSVADQVAGTIVVNRPPPQPHRAPAFPMYSAKDEEFGPKP